MLKFSNANAKIQALRQVAELKPFLGKGRKVYSFDILSGWSCPFANECFSKVVILNDKRKIKDGPNTQFRCFSASQEVMYTATYNLRKSNFDALKACKTSEKMSAKIAEHLPKNAGVIRIHVAGDFFNREYMAAWIAIAKQNPNRLFYAYTKSLPYWVELKQGIPDNFILTASYGGRADMLIKQCGLRSVKVVFSENEASELGLQIDHTDELAANPSLRNNDFALLLHGSQPAGSEAGKAISAMKRDDVKFSYSRKNTLTNAAVVV